MTPEEYRVDRDELISETIAGASGNNAIRTELWRGDGNAHPC